MISKIIKGTSFSKCIAYCLMDKLLYSEDQTREMSGSEGLKHIGRAEILEYNPCFGDAKELSEQFRDVAKLSRKVKKPVFHLTLRAAPGDQLTKAAWIEIGGAAAIEFGFSDHQFVTILHKDTKEPHMHVVANRNDFCQMFLSLSKLQLIGNGDAVQHLMGNLLGGIGIQIGIGIFHIFFADV